MPRSYKLKHRAQKQAATRQRIVEAAVSLHGTVGPAHTTISAIAEEAGVQRLTVYRHFPDERAIFRACTQHFFAAHPMPDPEPWRAIADPLERLTRALEEIYAYFAEVEPTFIRTRRDAPLILELMKESPFYAHWGRLLETLSTGWPEADPELLRAVIAHALDFGTWQSLVRQRGLGAAQVASLMRCLVRCAIADRAA